MMITRSNNSQVFDKVAADVSAWTFLDRKISAVAMRASVAFAYRALDFCWLIVADNFLAFTYA